MNWINKIRQSKYKKVMSGVITALVITQFCSIDTSFAGVRADAERDGLVDANNPNKFYSKDEIASDKNFVGKNDSISSTLLSMMGGIPIGKTVSYGFQFTNIRSFPVCATNNGAPEVGDSVNAICYNTPMPGVQSNPVVGFTTFNTEEGGAASGSMTFNTTAHRQKKNSYGQGGGIETINGTVTTQVNADVYQGNTGLSGAGGITGIGGNQWGWSNGVAPSNKQSLDWKTKEISAEDACTKYGIACEAKTKEEADKIICSKYGMNCKSDDKDAFTKEAVDQANKTGDVCGSLGSSFCGSQSPPKPNQVDWKSGNGIGNQISNLLNDKNGSEKSGSFNSSDNDWMKSSGGGKGTKNLDSFFGDGKDNTFNSGDYPSGLTTDSFGLDGGEVDENGNSPLFNSEGIDTYGKAGYNPADFVDENGNPISSSDFDSSYGNNFSNILQDSLHDGINKSNMEGSSLFEDADKSNSLAGMIHNLLSGDENGYAANNNKATLSNQDLFDIAKRLLLEAGFSENDIKKGLNYDKDSAYTEPNVAWDFNRMTTLLKARKVNFDNAYELQQKPKAKHGTGSFGM
jgi:hypothetical protein